MFVFFVSVPKTTWQIILFSNVFIAEERLIYLPERIVIESDAVGGLTTKIFACVEAVYVVMGGHVVTLLFFSCYARV